MGPLWDLLFPQYLALLIHPDGPSWPQPTAGRDVGDVYIRAEMEKGREGETPQQGSPLAVRPG